MEKGQIVFIKNWMPSQYTESQPAIVTKVREDGTVNLQVIPDLGTIQAVSSIKVWDDTEEALDNYLAGLEMFGRQQMFAFE